MTVSTIYGQHLDSDIFHQPKGKSQTEIFDPIQMAISPDQRQSYHQLAVSYAQDGMEYLKEAKQVAEYLYDDIAREACTEAIQIACTTIATGGNWQLALAAMSISLGRVSPRLGQYWGYLDALRMKAEECFNMHDFYMNIVRKG